MLPNFTRNALIRRSFALNQRVFHNNSTRLSKLQCQAPPPPCNRTTHRSMRTLARRRKATLASGNFIQRKPIVKIIKGELRKQRTIPLPRWISPQHATFSLTEIFGHSSFILVAISYAVDDFLQLRILAVAGSAAMLVFTYVHPHGRVLWLPLKWNVLFIGINLYRIGRVYWDRHLAGQLSDEFLQLREKHFYLMELEDFAKLVRLGTMREYKKGDLIVAQGENNGHVRLVLDGHLKVLRDGQLTYMLDPANFLSECGLHAGLMLPGKMESCCAVAAHSDTRLLVWDRTELIDLMHRDAGVRRSLKAILTWDVVSKLKSQRLLLAGGLVDDAEAWTRRRNDQTRHRYAAILHNLLLHPYYLNKARNELNKYRMIHHIDDEVHERALEQVGWTPEEFQRGHQQGHEEDALRGKKSIRWYVRDYYLRVFGY